MKYSVICDWALIVGCTCYVFVPFDSRRIREHWAKLTFILGGMVGIAKGVFGLMLDMGRVVLSIRASNIVHTYLTLVSGVLLGLILALIISGQLLGAKIVSQQIERESTT